MVDGQHQDFRHTALPLQHSDSDTSSSSQKLLVAVTIAALIIAGSTLAYRTRSYPFSVFASSAGKPEDANSSAQGKDQVQGKDLSNGYADATAEGNINGEDGEDGRSQAGGSGGKDSKSSRKKDRRKRGKDPLKEILKGKSKGKTLEQLLESSTQTPTISFDSAPKDTNNATNNASGNLTQKLANGSTSGADTDPEKGSTQLADVSQSPDRPTFAPSSPLQPTPPLLLSTGDRTLSKQNAESAEILQGSQLNGDQSPLSAASDTTPPFPHNEALAAYHADADADRNTRSVLKNDSDQALGAAVGSFAVEGVNIVSSSSTVHPAEIEGESAGETETSAGMSLSSSIVFSDSGIVRSRGAEEAEITPVTSPASSEKSGRTPKVNRDSARAAPAKPESKTHQSSMSPSLVDPWGWDGVSTNVPSPTASTSSKSDRPMNTTSSRVPLPGSPILPAYASFSSAVLSNHGKTVAPSSSSDPLSDSHEPGMTIRTSTSAPGLTSTRNNVPSSSNVVSGENEYQSPSKDRDDEETTFSFPTLNPPSITASAGAGPSRIRSSLGDVHSSTPTGRASPSTGAKRRPPTPSRNSSHSHSRNASNSGTPPPQRPMTPNSSSAPGSESPTPSQTKPTLSAQTQLASMRGALEASRLREEKNKAEIEKYMKELETMKWESANWRRAEIELQAQIRNLMHQLQIYTNFFAANAHLQQQYIANNGGPSGPNASSSPSTLYPANPPASSLSASSTPPSTSPDHPTENASSSPSQNSQQTGTPSSQTSNPPPVPRHPVPHPLSLHMLHSNGVSSPSTILSPSGPMSPGFALGPYPGVPPPFFPYGIPPHLQPTSPQFAMAHAQHMHIQQQFHQHQASFAQVQAQSAPSPHQASLFSAIFPPPSQGVGAQFGGTPPSTAGTSSSVGSQSPDRSGSPISGPSLSNRRSRSRIQTTSSLMGGRTTWEETGDGWVGNDGETPNGPHELDDDDAESEGGFNEVLADAIFKRPASIRVRSSSRSLRSAFEADKGTKASSTGTSPGGQASEDTEQFTEFAFPSLTDMGNIIYQSSVKSTNNSAHNSTSASTSSSLSMSPAVGTSDVAAGLPEETPASNDAEEERSTSLPPVIEQPEDAEGVADALVVEGELPKTEVTPTQGHDVGSREEHSPISKLTSDALLQTSAIEGDSKAALTTSVSVDQ